MAVGQNNSRSIISIKPEAIVLGHAKKYEFLSGWGNISDPDENTIYWVK